MIEELLRDFLAASLSFPVYLDVPRDHPSEYYVLEKTGMTRDNFIWESVFALQSYSDRLSTASDMIEDANRIMLDELIKLDDISRVYLNGSSNFTDTSKKIPRYQSVFVVTHY